MEAILFILVLAILIMVILMKNDQSSRHLTLQRKLDEMSAELKRIKSGVALQEGESKAEEKSVRHVAPVVKPEPVKQSEPIEKKIVTPPPVEIPKEPIKKPEEVFAYGTITEKPAAEPIKRAPQPKKPGFFERNPDLEKFIGENLANKIGIGVLVLGIGFFVKYAIDQNWIGEIGRVFIGILCGGLLIGIAHKMRKSFAAFSSVLVGGGIAILYLTIAIAFHEYQIFSQTAAFVLMTVITGFTILLSLGYNRIELAVLAILGGFGSPFMVSTGEGNYIVLFTYILILNGGMLVLAYHKKWNLVNIICYVFTLILFGSWLGTGFNYKNGGMVTGALVFGTLFYLVFFAMNIINNLKERVAFRSVEITMLLSNTFCYYAAGIVILDNPVSGAFKGLFTAALAVFNFIFAYSLYKQSRVDRNLVFLLIGLVLTFISLAAPVQLEGNYITLFWSAETVLLLWLSQKSGIRLMKLASVVIMGLMLISLFMDWDQLYFQYSEDALSIILNKAYITGCFSVASIVLTLFLLKKESSQYAEQLALYKPILTVAGLIVLYASQFFELNYQLQIYVDGYSARVIIIGCYNMFFILLMLLFGQKLILPDVLRQSFAFLGVLAMSAYLFFYYPHFIGVRDNWLTGDYTSTGYVFHYVFVVLLIVISAVSLKKIRLLKDFNRSTHNAYSWFYVFFFVFLASAELDHLVVVMAYTENSRIYETVNANQKIGYPILWGIASFVLIYIGLSRKIKHLRVISLTLFLVTLLKLFIFDIQGISEGGKIAAFISLGVLLLVVSFMYQRLKKLLLADERVVAKPEGESEL